MTINIKFYSVLITLLFLGAIAFILYGEFYEQVHKEPSQIPAEILIANERADSAIDAANKLKFINDSLKSIKHENIIIIHQKGNSVSYLTNDSNVKLLTNLLPKINEVVERQLRDTN